MSLYARTEVENDTVQAKRMFKRELPKIVGYLALVYMAIGAAVPLRLKAPGTAVWSLARESAVFGLGTAGILLLIGAVFMRNYLLRKAPYTDFGPAASRTMIWSFRLFGAIGVPTMFFNLIQVILPASGPAGHDLFREWWILLLLVCGMTGWMTGRSLGGLVALLAIWTSGVHVLRKLSGSSK